MKPTTMMYRNLMAMDVEETIRAYPLDAVVLLAGCDKTVPAQLMGAASVDVPAIMVTGGPVRPLVPRPAVARRKRPLALHRGAARRPHARRRSTRSSKPPPTRRRALQRDGHGLHHGALVEALGMALPGAAAIPAADARRAVAEPPARGPSSSPWSGLRPSHILTTEAFDNAVMVLAALGGSTNAIIHLIAIAGRAGVRLPLERFDELAARTPLLVNLRPAGERLFGHSSARAACRR